MLADLSKHEDEFTLAKGGKGGKGNASFPVGKTVGEYEPGELGTERRVVLELKTVADVGFTASKCGEIHVIDGADQRETENRAIRHRTIGRIRYEIDLDKDMKRK